MKALIALTLFLLAGCSSNRTVETALFTTEAVARIYLATELTTLSCDDLADRQLEMARVNQIIARLRIFAEDYAELVEDEIELRCQPAPGMLRYIGHTPPAEPVPGQRTDVSCNPPAPGPL